MSETPQQRVSRWLNDPLVDLADTEVRKAIRAVLAENEAFMSYEPCPKCGCGVTASCYGCRLKAAEAERDALRLDLAEACRGAAVLARERNEAQGERDALRIDLQTADDQLRALRLLTSPTDYDMYLKVREDALREGKAERDALRADVERLERARLRSADWLTFEKLEAERDTLRQRVEELEREFGPCLPECIPPGVHSLHCTRAYLARTQSAVAERDALRALLHQSREVEGGAQTRVLDLEAERDALREIMRRLVDGIDEWNSAVTPIIGRPVDYKWLALEEARAALTPEGKP